MIEMSEPNIQSYERPLLITETEDYGELNFYDSFFSVGVVLFNSENPKFMHLPEQVGSWQAIATITQGKDNVQEFTDAVKCVDQSSWSGTNMFVSTKMESAME